MSAPGQADFDALLAEVTASAGGAFGHRQHVQLTWLAVRAYGMPAAVDLVCEGIETTARNANVPQKYHLTMTRAWVELVAFHVAEHPADDFDAFVAANPALLDKQLLSRFYLPRTLASPRARAEWVEPDAAPFAWGTRVFPVSRRPK